MRLRRKKTWEPGFRVDFTTGRPTAARTGQAPEEIVTLSESERKRWGIDAPAEAAAKEKEYQRLLPEKKAKAAEQQAELPTYVVDPRCPKCGTHHTTPKYQPDAAAAAAYDLAFPSPHYARITCRRLLCEHIENTCHHCGHTFAMACVGDEVETEGQAA